MGEVRIYITNTKNITRTDNHQQSDWNSPQALDLMGIGAQQQGHPCGILEIWDIKEILKLQVKKKKESHIEDIK